MTVRMKYKLNVWIIYCECLDNNGKFGAVEGEVRFETASMIGAGAEQSGKLYLVIYKVVIYLWWITKPWFDKVEHSNESFSRSFSLSNLSFVLFRVSVCEFLSRWTWWVSRSFEFDCHLWWRHGGGVMMTQGIVEKPGLFRFIFVFGLPTLFGYLDSDWL